jgi:1,2-diacylglycerol 3-alpha-glucosyltransferase
VVRLPSLKYLNDPPIYVAVLGTPRSTWSLTRKHFDVLHAHSPLTVGLLAYLTASTKNLPLIYTYHTSITDYTHYLKVIGGTGVIRHAARWFSATSTNLGDQIVVPSPKFYRLLLEQKVNKPIHVIPNGIELASFAAAKNTGKFRSELGIKPDAPILLSVGRVAPEKRLDFLIDAFTRIADQFPDARLVFAGAGSSLDDLKLHAAATKVNGRIHFLGMVDRAKLPDILHDSTIFLSASTTEVHPISVIEAIASGLPMLAVEDEAFEGMIEEGKNGYQVPLDVDVFAKKLAGMLQDTDQLERFGKKSVELSQKYSIEGQVQSLEALYIESVLQHWRGKHGVRERLSSLQKKVVDDPLRTIRQKVSLRRKK